MNVKTDRKSGFQVVGKNATKVDGRSLVIGKPKFTADIDLPETLIAKVLYSPYPHARILDIDTSRAEALPGVACVLTYKNTERIPYTTAGQGYPEPSPYDTVMFDNKVRFVGDRVAAVAAETEEIARKALRLINVQYQELEPVLSIDAASAAGAPIIHDEEDSTGIYDAEQNIAANVDIDVGDTTHGFAQSDVVVERVCELQPAQHTPIEPHVCLSYFDGDDRLVIRTSTQVPFHVRRIVARLINVPIRDIRVIKPRIGGGFGVKQEILLEDICAALTLRTGRPVLLEYNRREEFISSRIRHPMRVRVKLGAKKDGRLTAIEMEVTSNTGAYGSHSLTVLSNVGSKTLPLYNKVENIHFYGNALYTTMPVAGAYRGYGATQGFFALETAIDELAEQLGIDPLTIRSRNHICVNETSPIFEKLGEGREGVAQQMKSCELPRCITIGAQRIGWKEKRVTKVRCGSKIHGVGMAISMQGSGIPEIDMAAATIKMNEDGSFHLLVGATDLGTGSDTVLAQIAAEVLGVALGKIIVYSSDTDFTPFDTGAYASSTTYVSGRATEQAARDVRTQILKVAGAMLQEDPADLTIEGEQIISRTEQNVSLVEIGHRVTYQVDQRQIIASASYVPVESPAPFMANFAEVAVDTETGEVEIIKYVAVVDCGSVINPHMAEGQVEGAIVNGIGYALYEEMIFNSRGWMRNPSLFDYKIPGATDIPPLEVILVDSYEPTGPMGAKSIGEIGINGPLPTIANAIYNAVGVRLQTTPFTPPKILAAIARLPG